MNLRKLAAGIALATMSGSGLAAKPTSIVFQNTDQTRDGKPYARYSVKCSNGKRIPLTAWEDDPKWCVGDGESDQCERKQINAAKAACKVS